MALRVGMKPAAINKIKDGDLLSFILKCISPIEKRLSARELMAGPGPGPGGPPPRAPPLFTPPFHLSQLEHLNSSTSECILQSVPPKVEGYNMRVVTAVS